jgi:hypothetical protein
MKPDAIYIFIGPSISRRSPICSALFFKLIFKNNKFLYLYYRMLRHFGNESYFKCSYGNFNYRGESPNATPTIRFSVSEFLSILTRLAGSEHQARPNCTVRPDPECTQNRLLKSLPLHKTTETLALKHREFCTG